MITMIGKRILIELDEYDSGDSYAIDSAIEKVRYLISEGFTSGNSPLWYIEEMEMDDER